MYGARIWDKLGNSCILTDNIATIISAGTLIMPNNLLGDGTYGVRIALPVKDDGSSLYPVTSIGVIAIPTKFTFQGIIIPWPWAGDLYPFSWYADSDKVYYTKNFTTGVMTRWYPGNRTAGVASTWDGQRGAMPLASWDYPFGTTHLNEVQIWAAMAYTITNAAAGVGNAVFSIGDVGVSEVVYSIFLRKN
jgi:hypothetical protein